MTPAPSRDDIVTASLVDFVTGTRLSDIPSEAVARAKVLLLDALGCAMGGTQSDIGRAAAKALASQSIGNATCIGHPRRIGVRDAALLNAMCTSALDWDDDNGVGHPSSTIFPAALAMSEERQRTGAEFLKAYILGYEASSRVGRAIWPSPERYEKVWGVGTHQIFGAVTAAGLAAGLDQAAMLDAFGIAGSAAAVPSALKWNWNRRPLGWIKDAVAWPASQGVLAAMLAEAGFVGARDILDGDHGFWVMASSDRFDPEVVTAALGERYYILESATKPYPSCRYTHSMLEAIDALVREHRIGAQDVEAITVESLSDLPAYLDDLQPESSVDAQFSAPICAALVICRIPPGPRWFDGDTLRSSEVRDIAARVRLVADPEADRDYHRTHTLIRARVSIDTRGGGAFSAVVEYPKGEPENPITDREIEEKYFGLAGPIIGDAKAKELAALVAEIERLPSISVVTELLR